MARRFFAFAFGLAAPVAFVACARGPTTALEDRSDPSRPSTGDGGVDPDGSPGVDRGASPSVDRGVSPSVDDDAGVYREAGSPATASSDAAMAAGLDALDASPPPDGVLALEPEHQGLYPTPAMDLAPGQPPSPEAPYGTVYFARCEDDGTHVTEWNLATKARRRSVALPPKNGYANARLLHTPGALHALVWNYNEDIAYVRLTDDLRVLSATRLGQVSVLGPTALASDGEFTLVLLEGGLQLGGMGGMFAPSDPSHEIEGLFAASFDANGHLVATRVLEKDEGESSPSLGLSDNAVVESGKAFVALRARGGTGTGAMLRVLRLDRQLHVEQETRVRAPEAMFEGKREPSVDGSDVTLFSRGDRLFVESLDAPSMTILSLAGTELGRIPRPLDSRRCSSKNRVHHDVMLGREHVWVATGELKAASFDVSIEWSHEDHDTPWIPPCPGTP